MKRFILLSLAFIISISSLALIGAGEANASSSYDNTHRTTTNLFLKTTSGDTGVDVGPVINNWYHYVTVAAGASSGGCDSTKLSNLDTAIASGVVGVQLLSNTVSGIGSISGSPTTAVTVVYSPSATVNVGWNVDYSYYDIQSGTALSDIVLWRNPSTPSVISVLCGTTGSLGWQFISTPTPPTTSLGNIGVQSFFAAGVNPNYPSGYDGEDVSETPIAPIVD